MGHLNALFIIYARGLSDIESFAKINIFYKGAIVSRGWGPRSRRREERTGKKDAQHPRTSEYARDI